MFSLNGYCNSGTESAMYGVRKVESTSHGMQRADFVLPIPETRTQ